MPKEYTPEEVMEKVLTQIWNTIEYWDKLEGKSQRERMEGLAFSMLVILDGGCAVLPGFIVAPLPHPTDKDYHIDNGEDYFPENHEAAENIKADIAGALHEYFDHYNPFQKNKQ